MFEFEWMNPLLNADGDIGAASTSSESAAIVSESPSVAAGAEASATGNAPAVDTTQGNETVTATPDVSQQESFASRLKEERSKIEGQYKPIQTAYTQLEQVARIAGFNDVGQYLNALDQHAKEQHAAAEANRLGVDEETYKQFFAPVHDELSQTKQELQRLQQSDLERQVRADYDRLKSQYSDFESVQDKVFAIAEQRVLPLEDAYKLAVFEERVTAAKQEGQAAAIQAMKANANSATGSVGGDAPNQDFDFTKLSPDERAKYYERAKRGELKSLR
ncbi:MAG: hypothetical protein ACE3L7_25570 [Candidatus Pristimantibacillus sp.]